MLLGACVAPSVLAQRAPPPLDIPARLQGLLPADALLLGEQHDNPDHQRIQAQVVQALVVGGQLAAVVLEMAEQPHTTALLAATASEADVQTALRWDEKAWPWSRYAPAVMAAVRAGVPVRGANLPRAQMREAMGNTTLDTHLDAAALAAQQQAIREGHCNLLPETQIAPMTRIQIARDAAMAGVLGQAVAEVPGKTVLLIAGSGHVDKALGIARHLPGGLNAKAVLLSALEPGTATSRAATAVAPGFDTVWPSLAIAPKDYCAAFKAGTEKGFLPVSRRLLSGRA